MAYPGSPNELKDSLAVEAFIDSLGDTDLEVSVKDRFPKTLAEAFNIATRLEANRPSSQPRELEARKEKSRGHRSDVEARRVGWDEADVVIEKLSNLEKVVKNATSEQSKRDDDTRVHTIGNTSTNIVRPE